jgi:hypothetical protein
MRVSPVVVAVVVLLILVIGYAVWVSTRNRCNSSADCAAGTTCVGGTCVSANSSCGAGPACAPPAVCVGGTCVTPPTCGGGPPCQAGQSCVNGRCQAPAACGNGPPCTSPDTCVNGQCVPPPACGNGPPCPAGQNCVGGQCVPPPACGSGPPCVAPGQCVNGICVTPPPPPSTCGGGPPCAPPLTCIGGAACGRLQGSCYGWVPVPLTSPAVPPNAVGVTLTSQTSQNMPAIAVDASGEWFAGAAYLPQPLPSTWSAAQWLTSFSGYWLAPGAHRPMRNSSPPVQMYYLAANSACSLTPNPTSNLAQAITGNGVPVCWTSARGPAGGSLVPAMVGGSPVCDPGTALISM